MNILIDVNHPCHVHIFKNFYRIMNEKGHNITVTCKNIPSAVYLLNYYDIPFELINYRSDNIIGKGITGLVQNFKMLKIVKEKKIDIGIGSSMNIAQVSLITKMKSVIIDDDDDEVEPLYTKFVHPFADIVLSPIAVINKRKTKKAIFYPGYHELAYLHPNSFWPNDEILKQLGVNKNEKYTILRFNAFKAHHDLKERGLSKEQKHLLINKLKDYGKVFISTERDIDAEYEDYKINIKPEHMHDALYHASMFIGDSQTMTSEAAVLGTPALRCNSFVRRISYLEEQEKKYGLTYGFLPNDFDELLGKIDDIYNMSNVKMEWKKRRNKLLSEKIDTTKLFVWFVENYPESYSIMKNNPDYQNNFRN